MAALKDLPPETRALITALAGNVQKMLALHDNRQVTMVSLLELCLHEIRNSRPNDYPGSFNGDQQRDDRRRQLIEVVEATVAQARTAVPVRAPRSLDPSTGD